MTQGTNAPDLRGRRAFLRATAGMTASWALAGIAAGTGVEQKPKPGKMVKEIKRSVLWNGRAGGTTWFHPRACSVPTKGTPLVFMTLQSITGSDMFGHVHWSASKDLGKTWTDPQRIAALGRHPARNDLTEGVCDVVPEYHARTNTILAMGHNVYYDASGKLARPQLERYPMYVVRTADGRFSSATRLQWDDPRGSAIYTCGCAQRITLANGDLLIPLSFGPQGKTARSVGSVLCSFNGRTVTIQQCSNELTHNVKRGLLEPTLAQFQGKIYMTIRAEDERGYVTSSADGLNWDTQQPWCWDNGEPLTLSTTQQRWLPHSDALYLVYTRRAEENTNVFRWRAPLYMAQVDTTRLCLIRSTEQVVLALIGDGVNAAQHVARMGNFHTMAVTPQESWVTVGECLPHDGWRGDVLMACIRWSCPNTLVP
jgi:hypothetical protein